MSGIAGLLHLDGRPAHPDELAPALDAMRALGPDGAATWAEGSLALGHLARHTTPEAAHEQWPLCSAGGSVLVADARLDNRDDLIRALQITPPDDRPTTDAELILAAHERWGDEAPAHLIGDFAYALWDRPTRQLRLVRSPFGMRGLFYRQDGARLLVATTLRGVLALDPQGTLNLPWLAGLLARTEWLAMDQTAVGEVRRVRPAHLRRIDGESGQAHESRFWALAPTDAYEGWDDEAWVDAFRERFEQAVAAALRTAHPVALSLSGGMDSSAIALVAHRLMHGEGRVPTQPVHLLSMRAPDWPETDEGRYRDAVVARLPHFRTQWIDLKQLWTWPQVETWQTPLSMPFNLPSAYTFVPRIERARELGCRVMLSGVGGDLLTGSEDYARLDAFESLPPRARVRELPHFVRRGWGGSLWGFARAWGRARAPAALEAWWQARRSPPHRLTTEHCRATASHAIARPPLDGATPLQRHFQQVVLESQSLYPFEQNAELFALQGMDYRCPFYDRRLVELAFHQPMPLRVEGGQTRRQIRQALRDDWPPDLLQRDSKVHFTRFTAHSIAEADHWRAAALPPGTLFRRQGWIDPVRWVGAAGPGAPPLARIMLHRAAHLAHWIHQLSTLIEGHHPLSRGGPLKPDLPESDP